MAVELGADVFASTAHELVCQIVALIEKQKTLEVGDGWFTRTRPAMTPELVTAIAPGAPGHALHGPWSGMVSMSYTHRWATVDDLLHGLESEPQDDLILQVADVDEFGGASKEMADWVLRTAAGEKVPTPELGETGAHASH